MIINQALHSGAVPRFFRVQFFKMTALKNIIQNIKMLVLDVDGVLTDSSLFYNEDGEALKRFHVRDGQGIKLAQAYNLQIAVISGRECKIVRNRCSELGIEHVYLHCHDKVKAIKELADKTQIPLSQIAYIGDDILDVPPLEIVGLPICPKDGHPSAMSKAKLFTEAKGGEGCVREIIDLILVEQGKIQI